MARHTFESPSEQHVWGDSTLMGVFPDCAECEIAQRDHLMQIYDPGIDFCAKCVEAKEDHRSRKCSDKGHPEVDDECNLCAADLAQSIYDRVQIQAKYSNSRETLKRKALELDQTNSEFGSGSSTTYEADAQPGRIISLSRPLPPSSLASFDAVLEHGNLHSQHEHSAPSMAPSLSSSGTSSASASNTQLPSNPLYCHWTSNSFTCEDPFFSEADLNDHIKKFHVEPAKPTPQLPTLHCSWDSCDASVRYDDLFDHIKSDHMWMQPHIDCGNDHNDDDQDHGHDHRNDNLQAHHISMRNGPDQIKHEQHTHLTRRPSDEPVSTVCRWLVDGVPCNVDCGSAEKLSEHLAEHVGARKMKYVCMWENCDRKCRPFAQKQKIIRHMYVHSNYKPFECNVCHARFSHEPALRQHERVHSGEKPFQCKFCSRRFAASAALSVHLRLHTGEKPLKCKYCGKAFSESSNLNKHVRRHMKDGVLPQLPTYDCPHCSEQFTESEEFRLHMQEKHRLELDTAGRQVLPPI